MGMANHAKQRMWLRNAINYPISIKNLVATMFRIGLSKHHQLNIGRITLDVSKILQQILHFISRQRQPHGSIGLRQCIHSLANHINFTQFPRCCLLKQHGSSFQCGQHYFRHAIVQTGFNLQQLLR